MGPPTPPEKNIIFFLDKGYDIGYKRRNWYYGCR